MAKGTKGSKDNKHGKNARASSVISVSSEPEKIDLRTIKIVVEKVKNVEPVFTATDISLDIKHLDVLLGQSERFMIHEKTLIPLDYEVEASFNVALEKTLAELISEPLYFTAWQWAGKHDIELYPTPTATPDSSIQTPAVHIDSILSFTEAILGLREIAPDEEGEEKTRAPGKVRIKDKKGDKLKDAKKGKSSTDSGQEKDTKMKSQSGISNGSEESRKTKSKESIASTTSVNPDEPVCIGNCNLDLLPFFLGQTEIEVEIPIYQEKIHLDDEMIPAARLPLLTVKVSIDKPIFDATEEERKLANVLNFTVEGIFNLPENFPANMEGKIATVLPAETASLKPICIPNGKYREGLDAWDQFKLWPNLSHIQNFGSCTEHRVKGDTRNIKNKMGVDIKHIFKSGAPRIVWNILQKCWLTEASTEYMKKILIRYRQWPVEIYLTPTAAIAETKLENGKKDKSTKGGKDDKKSKSSGSSKGSKDSKGSKKGKDQEPIEPLHYMGFADLTNLLFPGVTKTRVACALRTFQPFELKMETGLENSFFASNVVDPQTPKTEKSAKGGKKGKEKDGGKNSKKDGKGSEKSDKGKESKKSKDKQPLQPEVEVAPPEPEPSQPIVNEKGEPTFIILEVELMKPFTEQRTLEDLTDELLKIIPQRPSPTKTVQSIRLASAMYRECIVSLGNDLNEAYHEFTAEANESSERDSAAFIRHLQANGTYQKYMTTLLKPVSLLIHEKFHYTANEAMNNLSFDRYISNVYVNLINDMNTHLNGVMNCDIHTCGTVPNMKNNDYVYCSKEALELDVPLVAERYQLEILSKDIRDPNVWLNYAIYHMSVNDLNKAFECVKESLALKFDHKYSLLLFAIILYMKNDHYLSETALLTLLSHYSRFLEGWVCLALLYLKMSRLEGFDVCLGMINKYKEVEENRDDDYIYNTDGLVWTTSIAVKDNVFFQTAMTLIKLRALDFADLALRTENFKITGAHSYYQGVIAYFKKDYKHALIHLDKARKMHGPDYAVNSMIGHCHFRLGHFRKAKEAYEFITYAFNRPEDMHMLYLRLGMINESENNLPVARKYLLYVCKLSPTAYSWVLLAAVFYKEKNYYNAEVCLNESNLLDSRLAETWAYLTLINLKKGVLWKAEQCHSQMLQYKLNNVALFEMVEEEMEKRHKK